MQDVAHKTEERNRLSSEDWVGCALEVIAEQGLGALAIEPLARRLGVTKGSFYWHFRSRDALLASALARWSEQGERELLEHIASIHDPRARLQQLFQRVATEIQSRRIHAALLKALEIPRVRDVVEQAARRHLDILATAYRQTGQNPEDAQNGARLAYAAYLGFMQMNLLFGRERLSHEQYDSYVAHLVATLIPRHATEKP